MTCHSKLSEILGQMKIFESENDDEEKENKENENLSNENNKLTTLEQLNVRLCRHFMLE